MTRHGRSRRRPATGFAPCLLALAPLLLVVTPASAQRVRKLSAEGLPTSQVQDYLVSPDGRWVVFRQDADVAGAFELFAAPVSGGSPVRLSAPLTTGQSTSRYYAVSSDSQDVLFIADQETPGTSELWRVPISGPASQAVKLSPPMAPGLDVSWLTLGESAPVVLFYSDASRPECVVLSRSLCHDLYVVPIAGPPSSAVRLNPDGVSAEDGPTLELAPARSRVVFRGTDIATLEATLFSVPLDGPSSELIRLTPVGSAQRPDYFVLSSDSQFVVYRAGPGSAGADDRVVSVPVDGPVTAAVQLSIPLGPDDRSVTFLSVTPDATTVLYEIRRIWSQLVGRLFSVPITGPSDASVELSPPATGPGGAGAPIVTLDSATVVFGADLEGDLKFRLYTVPIGGPSSAAQRISVDMAPGGDVTGWYSGDVDQYEVYAVESVVDGSSQLFRVPATGPEADNIPLTATPVSGGTIEYSRFSPQGDRVYFWGDFAIDGIEELFSVPLDGPPDAVVKVSAPIVPGGNVLSGFQWTPDDRELVYRADQEVAGKVELYLASVPLFRDGFESGTTERWSSATP
jgi:hypothetical protein